MNRFLLWSAVVAVLAFAGMVKAADVIVPVGDKPCEVTTKEVVRVTATGISGSSIDVKVEGKAKDRKSSVVHRAGGMNEIGSTIEEHDITPTGPGTIKVKVTIKPPNGDAEVKEYEIVVK